MPDPESLSHPGERLPNWLARSLSQAFTPRASAVAPQRRTSELSDDEEDFDFATSTATTTATAAGGAAATMATTRRGGGGVHDAFKPSSRNNNAIALTASVGPQGWSNAAANNNSNNHQAPLHQTGLDLAFHNLSFRAGGKGARGKDILREASGYALAGRLTAVQGPSGAGKSTLLKILACNVSGGEVHGSIYVNGSPIVAREFRAASAVVWQRDILLPTATVREAIMTSAELKLPQGMPREEKRRRVDQIVTELGLSHRADMMIGEDLDGTVASVSGGERRRVSIGIALVTDPRAVFLDEPTTGLDSDGALSTVRLLKRLAAAGRTVLTTIHQPSADICQRYDDFLLVAGGRVLYCGPWADAEAYFDALGRPRPAHRNLAEHIMALSKDARLAAAAAQAHSAGFSLENALGWEDEEEGGGGGKRDKDDGACASSSSSAAPSEAATPKTPANFDRSLSRWSLRHTVTTMAAANGLSGDQASEVATSLPHQVRVLSVRFCRHMARAPLNVAVQLVQFLFFGVLLGLTYWRVPDLASGGTFDRVASLWFVVATLVLQPAQNAVAVFSRERALLRREVGHRLYSFGAYFIAKTLTALPIQLAFILAFSGLVYAMVGFQAGAAQFACFYGVLALVGITSDAVGQLAAALHREIIVGQILNGMVCLLLLMFTGFIQTKTPPYFEWLKQSSFVAFAYAAVVRNEFSGLEAPAPGAAAAAAAAAARLPPGSPYPDLPTVDGLELVPKNVNNGLSMGQDFGWLVGIAIAIRIATYFWINLAIKRHWL